MIEKYSISENDIQKAIDLAKEHRNRGLKILNVQQTFKKSYSWCIQLIQTLENRGIIGEYQATRSWDKNRKSLGHEVLI